MSTPTSDTHLSELLAELVAGGLSQEEALTQIVASSKAEGKKSRRRPGDAIWTSPAGRDIADDQVTHELVRADFERKCAEKSIPPSVYTTWPPAAEWDRFSRQDSRKDRNESGLVQASLNVDAMIRDQHQPVVTISEYATSAFDLETDRSTAEAFLADVARRKYPYLRIYSRRHDRVSRRHQWASEKVYGMLLPRRHQMDVDFVFTDVPEAPRTHFCDAFLSFHLPKFVEAEQASQLTRKRILDNFEPRAAEGVVLSGAYERAFGFTMDEDGNVLLKDGEWEWADEAFERLLAGETPYPIWLDLTARGMVGRPKKLRNGTVVPAGPVPFSSFVRMLSKPRWCAHRYFKSDRSKRDDPKYIGELIPVNIPQVIERPVWETEVLPKLMPGLGTRPVQVEHELSGIGTCPCGSHMIGTGDYYMCAAKMRAAYDPNVASEIAGMEHVTIPKAVFETAAEAVLWMSLNSDRLAQAAAEKTDRNADSEFERQRTAILADLSTIETKLKRLEIKVEAGFYDENPAAAKADRDELLRGKHELSGQLAALRAVEQPQPRLDTSVVRALWQEGSSAARREVYGKVFDRIEIAPTRRGRFIRHEERLGFVFKHGYEPPVEELSALLARLADERIGAKRAEEAVEGQSEFEQRCVDLHEAGIPNGEAALTLKAEFGTSPRGGEITSGLVWDMLRRHYGPSYRANKVRRSPLSLKAQKRLVSLKAAGHIWREVAILMEEAAKRDPELAHPKGAWTWQRARAAYDGYVRFGGETVGDTSRRRGILPDDVLARLDVMQHNGMSYAKLGEYVTSLGRYVTARGNTTWNQGTIYCQLRDYRKRIGGADEQAA